MVGDDVREVVAPEFEALFARGRSPPARVRRERAEVFRFAFDARLELIAPLIVGDLWRLKERDK